MPTRGVIYIATGHKYIEQFMVSLDSLRQFNPDLPVTLFTNQHVGIRDARVREEHYSFSDELWRDRIQILRDRAPYDYNLYIDADFLILDDLSDLFVLLDRFDFAVAHADVRRACPVREHLGIPDSFPEFAGGTQLFRKPATTSVVREFFDWWLKCFDEHKAAFPDCKTVKNPETPYHRDQAPLRETLWIMSNPYILSEGSASGIMPECRPFKWFVFPPEWSCHGHAGYLWDKVRMVQRAYGCSTVEKAQAKFNGKTERARVYMKKEVYNW